MLMSFSISNDSTNSPNLIVFENADNIKEKNGVSGLYIVHKADYSQNRYAIGLPWEVMRWIYPRCAGY